MKRHRFRCARKVDADVDATACPICGADLGRVLAGEPAPRSASGSGYNLVKLGFVPDTELAGILSKQFNVPAIRLGEFTIDADVYALVPAELARRRRLVPVNRAGASIIIAVEDPSNLDAIDEVHRVTALNVEVVVADAADIDGALLLGYG